jgi:hypothetical protein
MIMAKKGPNLSCISLHPLLYTARYKLGVYKASVHERLNNFLHHSSQFGFFLNIYNFRKAIMGRSGQRPDVLPLFLSMSSTCGQSIYPVRSGLPHSRIRTVPDWVGGAAGTLNRIPNAGILAGGHEGVGAY